MSSYATIDTDLGEVLREDEEQVALAIAATIRRQIEETYPPESRPARRDAHPKAHGCVRAEFRVEESLPPKLAQGVFVPGKAYQAWIRFSNGDANPHRDDGKGDSRGMAIKLTGIPGEKILPQHRDETTHDFIMINYPVFVIDDPARYLSVLTRTNSRNPLVRLTVPFVLGLRSALIAAAIASNRIASPLETRYWSATAYRLGEDANKQAIKFSARPCLPIASRIPRRPTANFLREAMIRQLQEGDARFDFLVQPRTSPSMSVEVSTVEWDESDAPFYKVATITIPKQMFWSRAQDEFGENLSFTPWHALPEHRPLGALNRVRRVVYEEVAALRRKLNGVSPCEPNGSEVFD